MTFNRVRLTIIIIAALTAFLAPGARAQFKSEAFSNGFSNGQESTTPADSVEKMFSLKEYMAGLGHKQELKIGTLFGGSTVVIGGQQIYHKQYWKLPIIYGGLATTVGGGVYFRHKYNVSANRYNAFTGAELYKDVIPYGSGIPSNPTTQYSLDTRSRTISTCLFAAAGAIYWGTLMDGVISFETDNPHHPGKATLYSILLPGLGQAYNGEYWKIPIYWGCLMGAYHFLDIQGTNYQRFRRIYIEASDRSSGYSESITADTALYYRDLYRRYRDYSLLAVAAFYLLQVIDANVFAYMQDFEVDDDISMRVTPTVFTPDTGYALAPGSTPTVGFSLGLRF